jgi:hypothetical protein
MGNQPNQPVQPQRVDLFQPIVAARPGPAPLALRVGVPLGDSIGGGVPSYAVNGARVETYVLLSALPEEMRKRVELAVQVLIAGR